LDDLQISPTFVFGNAESEPCFEGLGIRFEARSLIVPVSIVFTNHTRLSDLIPFFFNALYSLKKPGRQALFLDRFDIIYLDALTSKSVGLFSNDDGQANAHTLHSASIFSVDCHSSLVTNPSNT
jgi:hypothetical protein